ncbi:ABC-type Fe(III) dicitrate transporter ATP- binding protein [Hydrogenophaga taeniospiralis CCUG 15921]|uniref:ABC-type Fe(III) dicitrate transporter ATP-binding protein n=1 Tax=Hydrogenophaga taeniospiralis CCUG 15921 TaxID=1281780 RepID=A0A9X4NQI6_9BURK|nr:ABC transporter ATP-binding protein [Hydrogenophaga taeniospiralis]MDG5975865.1 ABC-type Fe(III) dicitrate transporter ATP- binding protein [Hydrogenophaga taeniospiralis CCUG 15921]
MLELHDLTLRIGELTLVEGLNLQLHAGQLHVIIGPNGTGKTSLLRALFGELPLTRGGVRLHGTPMTPHALTAWRQGIGYMPQNTQLDLDLSALEVVVLGRLQRLSMRLSDDDLRAALEALQALDIAHLADRPVHTLSGGQRQMVLFAQVLLRQPRLMLLDEPVSALDLKHQMQLMEHLQAQTTEQGWVSVAVLHDLNLAAQFADQLIVLGDGRLQAFGPPAEVLSRDLIHRLYHVPVDVHHDRDGQPYVRTLRATRPAAREGVAHAVCGTTGA